MGENKSVPARPPRPRILIAGAGALGSVFGGFLRAAGHDVTLLGRAPHLEAIERHGLMVDGIWGRHHVTGFGCAGDVRELRGAFDVVLVSVKSFDTAAMAPRIEA